MTARHRVPTPRRTLRPALTTTGSLLAVGAVGLAMAPAANAQAPRVSPARTGVPVTEARTLAPSPAAAETVETVVVVRGDTVARIAARTGRSTEAVLAANGLSPRTLIFPGQVLQLPAATATAAAMPAAPAASASAEAVLASARAQFGVSYRYGEESPERGFDCSGLVQWAYGQNGVSTPRTTTALRTFGTRVAAADARPGDLVLFNDYAHVAIYVGNGRIIDAPRTGSVVSERNLWTDRVVFRRVL